MNKSYGDFGVFQMPLNLFFFFLGAGAVFFFSYFTLRPLLNGLRDLYLIDFDIFTMLRNFRLEFSLLDINIGITFILAMVFAFTLFLFYTAHKNARELVRKRGVVPLVGYFLIYYILMAVFICMAVIELGIGRKQKW